MLDYSALYYGKMLFSLTRSHSPGLVDVYPSLYMDLGVRIYYPI
jgi:hypothetical protein